MNEMKIKKYLTDGILGILILGVSLWFWGFMEISKARKIEKRVCVLVQQDTVVVQKTYSRMIVKNHVRGKSINSGITRTYLTKAWYTEGDTIVVTRNNIVE